MKKITFLAALLTMSLNAVAQDYYNFTKTTGTYTDLSNATSMNNGIVWDWDDFGPVTTPFPVYVFGQNYDSFTFDDDYFYFENSTSTSNSFFFPVSAFIMDRNFSFVGASLTPISYKVEGATGSRILKLEVKNAGLETEADISSTSTLFLNFQIWFYEADKSIEYHYGNHNITDINMLNDEGMSVIYFGYEDNANIQAGYVDGTIASTTYTETTDPTAEPTNLGGLPAANTVYRFAVNPLAVKDHEKIEFSMFPNPTNDVLNLTFSEAINKPYSVYDLMGREVLKGSLNNTTDAQINVGTLQKGSYILRIAGSTQKFIKN